MELNRNPENYFAEVEQAAFNEEDPGGETLFRLGYPNREVRQGLNKSLLRHLVRDPSR